MALFSSRRERRLWLWTAAVVVAIYATLGLARTLSGFLREQGLLEAAFVVAMILVAAAAVAQGLKTRARGAEIFVGLGVAAVYLLVLVRMSIPEERTHLIEYGVVALLIHAALRERQRQGRSVPRPALLAIALTALAGAVDEGIQWLLPNRVFDYRDLLFSLLAGSMAVAASVALAWARARAERRKLKSG